jgi:hypothetical protein
LDGKELSVILRKLVFLIPMLLGVPTLASAQAQEWVGPLLWQERDGKVAVATRLNLAISEAGNVSGEWRNLAGDFSGKVEGKREKGGFALRVTFTDTTGCAAEARLEGEAISNTLLHWTARRVRLDSSTRRAQGKACANMENVEWFLQPL